MPQWHLELEALYRYTQIPHADMNGERSVLHVSVPNTNSFEDLT
jgi:hypothetical protein